MSVIAVKRPRFTPEEAAGLARSLYGVTGYLRALPSERDQNFHITGDNGEGFVLKTSGAAEKRSTVDLQHAALDHLASRFGEASWPKVCRTGKGESITLVDGRGGMQHLVRMLTFIDGRPLCEVKPHGPDLLKDLGAFLGRLTHALADFSHEEKQPDLIWNMDNGPSVVRGYLDHIHDGARRGLVQRYCEAYETTVVPRLASLPRQFIHNDANDQNVLVRRSRPGGSGGPSGPSGPEDPASSRLEVAGLIDFGDMTHSCALFEPAVAVAYVMLGKSEPLSVAAHVVRGYHAEHPLTELDLSLIYHCAVMRLCMSVCISAFQQVAEPDNTYLSVSEKHAWDLLEKLGEVHPSFAEYQFRDACQLPPCPQTPGIETYLSSKRGAFAPVMGPDVDLSTALVFDLSVGSPDRALLGGSVDVDELSRDIFKQMETAKAHAGIGRYNEARQVYTADQFVMDFDEMPERRTIHLGLDVFLPAGSPVYAPLEGTIHSFRNNTQPLDYGPCIILEHAAEDTSLVFYTLYGHLSVESLAGLYEGKPDRERRKIRRRWARRRSTAAGRLTCTFRSSRTCWATRGISPAWGDRDCGTSG